MRKQGETYLKLVSILLASVILAYVLFSVVLSSGSGYAFETVVYCEVGDGITVSGFVVRSERVLASGTAELVCERSEGEWVGSGQTVATGCDNADIRESYEELAALRQEYAQLKSAAGENTSEETIAEQIIALSVHTARHEISREADTELRAALRSSSGDAARLSSYMAELEIRIAALSRETAGSITAITADRSGYFSRTVDGYEEVLCPENLETISLSELRGLSDEARAMPADAIGRLIEGQKWYFVTELPTERVVGWETGDRLTVDFPELRGLTMRIERIGEAEKENCILVLSCEKYLQNMTNVRRLSANIICKTYEGLRVPKQAIYYIDGETGVYVLENSRAKWKKIELLLESGEDYIVRWDNSDTDNLWPKDELILTSEDIENGMVIE